MIGAGQASIPPRGQPVMGKIKVSDMIQSNVKVSNDGRVTGSINYLQSGEDVPKEGHYFPIQLDKQYYNKKLHAGGAVIDGEFVAGSDFTPTESDPYLNIRVESCTDGMKISVYDYASKDKLFTIDFNGATLKNNASKISTPAKTPVMSVSETDMPSLKSVGEDNAEKRYTKSEINRMSTADLQALASEKGVENAYGMTGAELKTLLVEMLVG